VKGLFSKALSTKVKHITLHATLAGCVSAMLTGQALGIDDFEINTVPWKKKGGTPIKHESAIKTIAALKEVRKNAKL